MKTGAIYARYSSSNQTEQSIEGQLRVCREYAERNGIIIVKTYIDRAMTSTNDNRDAFQQMLKDSGKKQWEVLLVYKLDRFSRNKYEMAIHRKHLKDNGVKILSAMEHIPDSPEGVLLESLLEGMNQYYSEELSQKVKRGLRESRIKGNAICNRVPYGWDKVNKKYVINEQEAEIVREIFRTYLSGRTMEQIAADLRARGIVNKDRPFKENVIYTMLHNEKYTGIYRIHDQVYDNIFPPIITQEIFEQTQKRLALTATGKHVPDVTYLLRGKIVCGHCGKRYVAWTGTDRYKHTRRYYRCDNGKAHSCKSIRKEILENVVVQALRETVGTKEKIEQLADDVLKRRKQATEQNTELKLMEKEQAQTVKSIAGIMKAIEMGVVTETTKSRLEELERRKRELDEEIAIAKANRPDDVTKEMIIQYIRYAFKQPQQLLFDLLIEKITIFEDKIVLTIKTFGSTSPDGGKRKHITAYVKSPDLNDRGSFYMSVICREPFDHAYRPTILEFTVDVCIRV